MRIRNEYTANVQMSMAAQASEPANVGRHFHIPAVKRHQAKPAKAKGFSFRSLFKSGKIGF